MIRGTTSGAKVISSVAESSIYLIRLTHLDFTVPIFPFLSSSLKEKDIIQVSLNEEKGGLEMKVVTPQ